jgi:hypothetical protein
MKAFLRRLQVRSEDAGENFRVVAKLIQRSRFAVLDEDVLVLPELS